MNLPTPGADTARASMAHIARLGETPRFWRLQAHEALWLGAAYDGRESFWNQAVPLRERAPAVQSQIVKACGRRLVTMTFGQRAFPDATVTERAYGVTYTAAEAATLTGLACEIVAAAKLRRVMREYLAEGLKCGSACVVLSLQGGAPVADIIPAKWCTPTLARDGSVTRLVIEYRYPMTAADDETRLLVYRREIGDGWDIVYQPWRADDDNAPVKIASKRAVSFVPVRWTRNLASSVEQALDIDGSPMVDGMEDEVEGLDMLLSMRLRNAYYNGDPQMVQIVGPADAPAPLGATGPTAADAPPNAGRFSRMGDALGRFFGRGGSAGTATKKGPGQVWKIQAPGDAKLVESSGAGAIIIDGAIGELRRVILDAIGVVMADPETMGKGDLSARALSLLHAPMLDVVSCLAEDYGAALCDIVSMFARMIVSPEGADGVHLLSAEAAKPLLMRLSLDVSDGAKKWVPLPLALRWGDPFEASWSDVSSAVESATKGIEGGAMSRRAAVAMLAKVRGGDASVDHELDAIEEDQATSRESVRATLAALPGGPADDAPTVTDAGEVDVDASVDAAPATDPAVAKDPGASLNGAQVSSLLEIIAAVAERRLPRATGVAIIAAAFAQTPEQAEVTMGEVGRSFFAEPAAPPPFGAPRPPPPTTEPAQ